MTTFLYILNVLFSSGQSAFGKQYSRRGGSSLSFNVNKAISGAILFLLMGFSAGFNFHLPTLVFGVAYGISLCISMHTGFRALATGPMALTSIIASFSMIIPFLFGILFWGEPLTLYKLLGIILLMVSILLINFKKDGAFSFKWFIYAFATLIYNGICSVIQKLHQTYFPSMYSTEFMFWAMLCVVTILALTMVSKNGREQKTKLSFLGIVSGVMNCLANYIVLYLSATENASVLFPIVSVANIIAAWLIGIVFFNERQKLYQSLGLVLGIASVILLKI